MRLNTSTITSTDLAHPSTNLVFHICRNFSSIFIFNNQQILLQSHGKLFWHPYCTTKNNCVKKTTALLTQTVKSDTMSLQQLVQCTWPHICSCGKISFTQHSIVLSFRQACICRDLCILLRIPLPSSPQSEKIFSTIYIMPVRPMQSTSSANCASSGRDDAFWSSATSMLELVLIVLSAGLHSSTNQVLAYITHLASGGLWSG